MVWISRLFNYLVLSPPSLSPIKRELRRLILCLLIAVFLNLLMFFGIDSDGRFKEGAAPLLNIALSTNFAYFCFYFLSFYFLLTVVFAWQLEVVQQYRRFLNSLSTVISGSIYCVSTMGLSLALQASLIDLPDTGKLAVLSLILLILGGSAAFLGQVLIQGTFEPNLKKDVDEEYES